MKISHTELKRCDLISLEGRIDSSNVGAVEAKFNELIENGRFRIVLDMSAVEYVSSAFLRVVISNLKTVKRWNRGNVYLAALSPRLHEVFDLAGLLPLFRIYETTPEAVGDW